MLPMFLIDQHVSASEVSFWTGLIGQGMSVVGSVLGGIIVSKYRYVPSLASTDMCRH